MLCKSLDQLIDWLIECRIPTAYPSLIDWWIDWFDTFLSNHDFIVFVCFAECPPSVLEGMKSHYISAVKDLRKGFPSVCELVSCALSAVLKNIEKDSSKTPYDGLRSFLTSQRFWVSCVDMRSRYGIVDFSATESKADLSLPAESVGDVNMAEAERDDAEACKNAATAKKKDKHKALAKRYRR